MAIRKLTGMRLDARHEARLRKGILAEMKRPDDTPPPAGGPVIYREESGTPERYTRWYVVWRQFEGVDAEDRSRVILDAVEQVFGRADALRVSIAMGLTPEDPVAQDIAGYYQTPGPARHYASVAESHAEYGTMTRGRAAKRGAS